MNKRLTTGMADANGLQRAMRPARFFNIKRMAADFCSAQCIMDNTASLGKQHDGRYQASNHRPSDLKPNGLTTTPQHLHISSNRNYIIRSLFVKGSILNKCTELRLEPFFYHTNLIINKFIACKQVHVSCVYHARAAIEEN